MGLLRLFKGNNNRIKLFSLFFLLFILEFSCTIEQKNKAIKQEFPNFGNRMDKLEIEHLLPAATDSEIQSIEKELGISLPPSYKRFLKCNRGLWALGGQIQMSNSHPFIYEFKEFDDLDDEERLTIQKSGYNKWPPVTQGMICFSEYFLLADGDQVYFNPKEVKVNNELSVYYYSHDIAPDSVIKISDSFEDWINNITK